MAYWLRDLSEENFLNVETLFPLYSIPDFESERWLDFSELDERQFCWVRLYDTIVSLVFVPTAYVTQFDGQRPWFFRDEDSRLRMTTVSWGMKLVSGNGPVVMLDEQLHERRFAIPTLEELLEYQDMVRCPAKYQKPLHRFLKKAIRLYRESRSVDSVSR